MMNPFALAYREQQQLFLLDKTFFAETLFQVGGLATLAARFVVQFFWSPALAVVLTVALLGLGTWLLWAALRDSRSDWHILPLCVIPFAFLAASLSENAMHYSILTAWLLALTVLWGYTHIRSNRLLWGIVLTAAIYLAAGPVALLFALCAALTGLFRKDWTSLLLVPVALGCGLVALWLGWTPTLATAWTPAFYFDLDAELPDAHWIPWVLLPLTALACECLKGAKGRRWIAFGICAAVALLALVPASRVARKAESRQSCVTFEYEYYVANEDWDGLVASCRRHEWLPHTAQYLNLALASKGTLLDEMFHYDQRGPAGLVRMGGDRGVEVSQAHILFTMGNLAGAQDVAFNKLYSTEGICPGMLKMNAQIELIRGAYDIAYKYLSILEKAPHYRAWAWSQRRFLNDDAAVEADPLLGRGRPWPHLEGFAMFESPLVELRRVVEANPANSRAVSYILAYMLLAKDVSSVTTFVDRFFGAPALQTLPQPVQEAVLFYSEFARNVGGNATWNAEWRRTHGVSQQTERRFEAFQQASVTAGGKAPESFRGTYWYYLMNTQI